MATKQTDKKIDPSTWTKHQDAFGDKAKKLA
jgi:hypothetical protein